MMWASIPRQLLSFVLTHGSCLAGDRWHPHLHTIKTLRDRLTYSVCGLQMSWISDCRSGRLVLSLHYLLRDWSFWQAYQNPSSFHLEAAGYLKQNPSFHKVYMKVYVADISQNLGSLQCVSITECIHPHLRFNFTYDITLQRGRKFVNYVSFKP